MSSNKSVKNKLIKLYGAECFIEKLHLRQDKKPRHYTSKGQYKRMKELTYHHILEKSKGGKATVENGALLSNENHQWFHKQSASSQGYMNAIFQEYKKQANECKVTFVDFIETPYKIDPIEISVENGRINAKKLNYEKDKRNEKRQLQRLKKEYEDR